MGLIRKFTRWAGNIVGDITGSNKANKIAKQSLATQQSQYNQDYAYRKMIDERNYNYTLNQHSHTVEDMKRAGLNPLLAAGATNSSPAQTSPGASGASAHGANNPDTLGGVLRSALLPVEMMKEFAQMKLFESESEKNQATTSQTVQQTEFFSRIQWLKVREIEQAVQTGAIGISSARAQLRKLNQEVAAIGHDVRRQNEKHEKTMEMIKLELGIAKKDMEVVSRGNIHSSAYKTQLGILYALGTAMDRGATSDELLDILKNEARRGHFDIETTGGALERIWNYLTGQSNNNTLPSIINPPNKRSGVRRDRPNNTNPRVRSN